MEGTLLSGVELEDWVADGPEAILYCQGYGERTALKLLNRYFFNLLGGVTTLRGSLCGGTGQAAQNLDLASPLGHLQVRIKNDPGVRPDCAVAERGGWIKAGHGLNRLTLDRSSHVGEGTPYYDTCVTLTAAPPTPS